MSVGPDESGLKKHKGCSGMNDGYRLEAISWIDF